MATRQQERERLREERLTGQREAEREARLRLIGGYVVAGVLATALVVAIVIAVASSGGGANSAGGGGPFGPHYAGLEARRIDADVTTMSTPNSAQHIHPQLAVYANGKQVEVPVNIGIAPGASPEAMAGLHTHDAAGTIHDEGMAGAKLGQFFAIWGVPFSARQLGPYEDAGKKRVRMWVDGKPSQAFGNLLLKDGQQIVVSYGTAGQVPKDLGD